MTEIPLGEVVPLEELRIDMSESLCLYPPVNEIVTFSQIDYFEYYMGLTRGEIPNLPLCPEYVLKSMLYLLHQLDL